MDTDGVNFSTPDEANNRVYVGRGLNWKVKEGKEYYGPEADVAEYNDIFMRGEMALDTDGVWPSTMYLLAAIAKIRTHEPATPPVVVPFRLMKSLAAAAKKPTNAAPSASTSFMVIEPTYLSVPFVPIFNELVAIVVGTQMVYKTPWFKCNIFLFGVYSIWY